MHKLILFLVVALGLPGCIKLQMPEDMVSDTIEAIKGDDKKNPAHDEATTFSHSVVGAADAAAADLKKQCLAELETRTQELLDLENPAYTVISESFKVTGDKAIASCTVSMS